MARVLIVATLLCATCVGIAASGAASVSEVVALIDAGQFGSAGAHIDRALTDPTIPSGDRQALEFQRERMRRILLDFTLTGEEVKRQLKTDIPNLRDEEFQAWDDSGKLEHQVIDGKRRYFHLAAANLYRVSPQALARRSARPDWHDSPLEKPAPHHREVIAEARSSGRTSVAARHVQVTQTLIVKADAVPPGETVRAWIPFPRAIPGQQEQIRLTGSTPARHQIAPESALQRTVYLESPARAGAPTNFSITYDLTIFATYHDIDAGRVTAASSSPQLAPYVAERPPHIVFTQAMRDYSHAVIGNERNPYRIAQKLFDAVDRIPWAGAREYSTISNIGDYALHAGHADCGQQTLVLMTLLRLNGVPARWQSGMIFSDGDYDNLHDWGQLYLAPYGWVPIDVTFGHLHDGDPAIDDFYFGGLDAYRIAFNDDFSQPLTPAKRHFRSETVDLQRGEAEWGGGNLYFDQWDYGFEAKVLHKEKSAGGKR